MQGESPVVIIRNAAATAKIKVTKLRGNVSVLEGSGGNISVLTGPFPGSAGNAPVITNANQLARKKRK